jgi:hypothetical protein
MEKSIKKSENGSLVCLLRAQQTMCFNPTADDRASNAGTNFKNNNHKCLLLK